MDTQNLLVIGLVYPEPVSSAAGTRMMQLLQIFLDDGYEVTFASAAQQSRHAADLNAIGIRTVEIELNASSFDAFLKDLNPHIVIFDRFMVEEQYGWRVAEICPLAMRILDSEDLHFLRAARHQALKNNKSFDALDLFGDVTKREIASILRCDLTLIVSEYEMQLLEQTFRIDASLLYYLPLFAVKERDTPDFAAREHFVFIGNFFHEPNCDAVRYLKSDIWPAIRKKFPMAVVKIYGAYLPPKIAQLHNEATGFQVCGRALDAAIVFKNARVLVAPLRFGAGLKGKLLEAMAAGTPSITTAIGAEAIDGGLPWAGVINDNAEEFADSAVKLYHDTTMWSKAQQYGYNILAARFSRELFIKPFVAHLGDLKRQLLAHRKRNFVGAVLLHHTAASTKYMSKWIEAKNR